MSKVHCVKCGQDAEAFEKAPYPDPLGKMIQGHVCPACYQAWQKFSVNVINDFKLRPFLPKDREVFEQHMKKFLNLELQTPSSSQLG